MLVEERLKTLKVKPSVTRETVEQLLQLKINIIYIIYKSL